MRFRYQSDHVAVFSVESHVAAVSDIDGPAVHQLMENARNGVAGDTLIAVGEHGDLIGVLNVPVQPGVDERRVESTRNLCDDLRLGSRRAQQLVGGKIASRVLRP